MISKNNSSLFFENAYESLRGFTPMLWMRRMFVELTNGRPPALLDLPTGSGKTDLVVVWLIALAWYGNNRHTAKPIPRRLVWVVNRRVLVQQVFRIATELAAKVQEPHFSELAMLRSGLSKLSGSVDDFFKVIELRGQIVADRNWAIRPAMPQLIVGTIDQIGSRILFQGYGLGKWGRPQQAGQLGVDAWIAVDEAHLVPAFVLTLRQIREKCINPVPEQEESLLSLFNKLPFWLTELSATPGLPKPSATEEGHAEGAFCLHEDERRDDALANRILASETRQVLIKRFPKGKKTNETRDALVLNLVNSALQSDSKRIAIFVREVAVADKVATAIKAKLKERGISKDHICKITGRIRGYERDQLAQKEAFRVFVEPRDEANHGPWFLVGTAAAEVGLDADADAVFCDFAALPILLQRLGRLDRRGALSRLHKDGKGKPPTMIIFTEKEKNKKLTDKVAILAKHLTEDTTPFSAELMAGAYWRQASTEENSGNKAGDSNNEDESKETSKDISPDLIEAATWSILNPDGDGLCAAPSKWLTSELAGVTSGPVIVPPVTDALLDYWAATSDARSPLLAPHPFLYGLSENDEGTPLVGVAFRLEVEALRVEQDDDNIEAPDVSTDLLEIIDRFPPLRSELHNLKLSAVREWLLSENGTEHPIVYRTHDEWRTKYAGDPADAIATVLGPSTTLILPANVRMAADCKDLLKDCEQIVGKHTQISDVLQGVADQKLARYIRIIERSSKLMCEDGTFHWDFGEEVAPSMTRPDTTGFILRLSKKLSIGGIDYAFRYYRPQQHDTRWQYLDDLNGEKGHLTLAKAEVERLSQAIAPDNAFLAQILSKAAQLHDEGKRLPKWQRAFGQAQGTPDLAKLSPHLPKPRALHGFRHEWESMLRLLATDSRNLQNFSSDSTCELWLDLINHLVGSHHGHLRPSIKDAGLTPTTEVGKQNPLRLEAAERFFRLQTLLGRWRLAYLEALLKSADAEGSQTTLEEEDDEQ